ncbi:MAG: TetR/AcrR family transcriptional regulator [Solobacterium sp.]|nr:TetR/AcrR family transcriptional regulator [Solobacterium sp.]
MKEPKDTEVRRSEFVEAAEKLFRENGIVDTTVNSIVRELDVAKGLFYYYFKSKDDVIDAISEKYNKDFRQAIQRSLDPANDFDERLNGFLENTITSFRTMWDNLQGKNDSIDLTILSSRSVEEAKQTASETLSKLLKEGNELKKMSVPNPEYFAKLIVSGIADLAGQAGSDLKEIKTMIDELIGKAGK